MTKTPSELVADLLVETTLLPCRTCGAAALLYKRQGTFGPLYYVRCTDDLHADIYKESIEQAILDWNTWARDALRQPSGGGDE